MTEKKLTDRQEWLVEYLKAKAEEDPKKWVTMQEIIDAINNDLTYCGEVYEKTSNPRSHNPCPALWTDKEAINANWEIDTPIIYNGYCLKIPTSLKEVDEYYCDDLLRRAKKMLWRRGVARRKAMRDGQMKIEIGPDGKPTERFIEAFVKAEMKSIVEDTE